MIAILAAITIVAYNGITQQARVASVQSALVQAKQKILEYSVTNSDTYPESLSTVSVTGDSDTSYYYQVDNSASPRTYCVEVRESSLQYYVSSAQPGPVSGYCTVTNLVTNPSAETGTTQFSVESGDGGVVSTSRPSTGAFSGQYFYRATWTTGSTGNSRVTYSILNVTPGSYCLSAYVRLSASGNTGIGVLGLDSSGGFLNFYYTDGQSIPANTWTRIENCFTATSSSTARFGVRIEVPPYGQAPTGFTMDVDAVMLTRGISSYPYADGTSTGWSWSSTAHGSTSSGPAL